jgi:hypothetical protein
MPLTASACSSSCICHSILSSCLRTLASLIVGEAQQCRQAAADPQATAVKRSWMSQESHMCTGGCQQQLQRAERSSSSSHCGTNRAELWWSSTAHSLLHPAAAAAATAVARTHSKVCSHATQYGEPPCCRKQAQALRQVQQPPLL